MSIQDLTINPKLKFFCQKVLPLVYDNSLSYYEAICKIASATNMLTDEVNELINYIKNLDTNIDEKIKNRFELYVNSDKFSDMIKIIITDLLEPFKEELLNEFEKLKNESEPLIYPKNDNLSITNVYQRMEAISADNNKIWCQSICYAEDGNAVIGLAANSTAGFDNNETNCKIQVISLSTNNVLREGEVPAYHCNSMVYIRETNQLAIVISPYKKDNEIISDGRIAIINYADLSFDKYISFENVKPYALAYDAYTNKYYGIDDDNLYELNFNDLVTNKICTFEYVDFKSINKQDMCVNSNIAYLTGWPPSQIIAYDIKTGKMIKRYKVPYAINDSIYTGELEGIAYAKDGDILLTSAGLTYKYKYSFVNIHKINLIKNSFTENYFTSLGLTNTTLTRIYVDATYTGKIKNGEQNTPFVDLFSALDAIRFAGNKYKIFELYIENGDFPFTVIQGINTSLLIKISSGVTIHGLLITNSRRVTIDGGYFAAPTLSNNTIDIFNSTVLLKNMLVEKGVEYALLCNYCELTLFNVTTDVNEGTLVSLFYSTLTGNIAGNNLKTLCQSGAHWFPSNNLNITSGTNIEFPQDEVINNFVCQPSVSKITTSANETDVYTYQNMQVYNACALTIKVNDVVTNSLISVATLGRITRTVAETIFANNKLTIILLNMTFNFNAGTITINSKQTATWDETQNKFIFDTSPNVSVTEIMLIQL